MVLSDATSVSSRGLEAAWGAKPHSIIGHTHPRGELYLSHGDLLEVRPGVYQAVGDVPALKRLTQERTAVIAPHGRYRILDIADYGGGDKGMCLPVYLSEWFPTPFAVSLNTGFVSDTVDWFSGNLGFRAVTDRQVIGIDSSLVTFLTSPWQDICIRKVTDHCTGELPESISKRLPEPFAIILSAEYDL
jgi:hypothetical protein